jgi:hypothetical protein
VPCGKAAATASTRVCCGVCQRCCCTRPVQPQPAPPRWLTLVLACAPLPVTQRRRRARAARDALAQGVAAHGCRARVVASTGTCGTVVQQHSARHSNLHSPAARPRHACVAAAARVRPTRANATRPALRCCRRRCSRASRRWRTTTPTTRQTRLGLLTPTTTSLSWASRRRTVRVFGWAALRVRRCARTSVCAHVGAQQHVRCVVAALNSCPSCSAPSHPRLRIAVARPHPPTNNTHAQTRWRWVARRASARRPRRQRASARRAARWALAAWPSPFSGCWRRCVCVVVDARARGGGGAVGGGMCACTRGPMRD